MARVALFLVAVALLSSMMVAANNLTSATAPQFPVASGSWNPRVPCSSPWIVKVTDVTHNMTGSSSQTGSIFNPGDPNKRWLTPGPTPPGWVSPGPPCTVSNSHGTVSVFVEIDGVRREGPVNEDCSGTYDTSNGGRSNGGSFCDTTFNIFDPAIAPNGSSSCSSSTDPTCYGKIHSEIDRDWKAAHYCGSSTTCDDAALGSQITSSTLLDVQGYVYWDPDHLTAQWHNFNGWELHPFTAWRLHQSNPSLTSNFAYSPSSPSTGQTVTFTGSASGGTSPYTFHWSFGDGANAAGNPVTHSYTASGTFNVQLTVQDSAAASSSSAQSIVVTQPATPDFTISPNPSTLQLSPGQSSTSTITLTSLGGFTGTVNLFPDVYPNGPTVSVNPASLTLTAGGSGTSRLTVSTQSSTSLGNYTVTIVGNSSSISHSTSVRASVRLAPEFSINANPSTITIARGSSGTSNLTLTSMNGFNGPVVLSVSTSPSGPKTALSSNSVTLASGGSSSVLLTIKTLKKTLVGNYVVTVTATSGTLVHSTTISLSVT
jgi:PKD domain